MTEGVSVGDLGKASTPLRPSGRAIIRGTMHSVRAESGYVEEGCMIIVVRADQFGLLVRLAEDIPKHRLPDVGTAIASTEQATQLRHEKEEQVRRDADREERVQSRKEMIGCGLIVGIPASIIGYWIAGGTGAAVGGIGVVCLVLLVRLATELFS